MWVDWIHILSNDLYETKTDMLLHSAPACLLTLMGFITITLDMFNMLTWIPCLHEDPVGYEPAGLTVHPPPPE